MQISSDAPPHLCYVPPGCAYIYIYHEHVSMYNKFENEYCVSHNLPTTSSKDPPSISLSNLYEKIQKWAGTKNVHVSARKNLGRTHKNKLGARFWEGGPPKKSDYLFGYDPFGMHRGGRGVEILGAPPPKTTLFIWRWILSECTSRSIPGGGIEIFGGPPKKTDIHIHSRPTDVRARRESWIAENQIYSSFYVASSGEIPSIGHIELTK